MNSVPHEQDSEGWLPCHEERAIIIVSNAHAALKDTVALADILGTTAMVRTHRLLMLDSWGKIIPASPQAFIPKPFLSRNKISFLRRKMEGFLFFFLFFFPSFLFPL